jgi:hypothetical protein
MDHNASNEIRQSPFPAIAAEVRRDWEAYARKGGLPTRLDDMVRAGIMSEVLDLLEALRTPVEDATDKLASTYERAAMGAAVISRLIDEDKPGLAAQDEAFIQECTDHALGLRSGSISLEQELAARIEQRRENGQPDNFYLSLLYTPVFDAGS